MDEIVTMGELLVDFIPIQAGNDSSGYYRMPGGAPANVAAGVARLGGIAAFAGKTGKDFFGDFLSRALADAGVDTTHLLRSSDHRTSLAFVSLDHRGERSFLFYRDRAADTVYGADEIPRDLIRGAMIFHYGSISLISRPARDATLSAARLAREKGRIVSYDPNLRLNLWPDPHRAKDMILRGMKAATVVKLSEEELVFITNELSVEAAARMILKRGPGLVFVTLGESGCYVCSERDAFYMHGFRVEPVDTTGAGDAFMAAVLFRLQRDGVRDPASLEKDALLDIARFANAAGALVTTRKGAISAMPGFEEVKELINSGADA